MGLWEQGHENGVGKLTKKNNDVFDGVFVNGKLDGEVVIHYADGTRFRGTFRNGLREGKAIEEDAKGVRFEGSYHEDERDGSFVERDKTGAITAQGRYENGKRIEM